MPSGIAGPCGSPEEKPITVVDGPQILVSVTINGYKVTIAKRNLEHFDSQDPYFFDSDYTIAGSTGFLLWEANWLLLRLLRSTPLVPNPGEAPGEGLQHHSPSGAPPIGLQGTHLGRLLSGRRVLDLGSGTGMAGLCAAACGAHVLLTDLASVCAGTLRANVQRNASASPPEAGHPQVQSTHTRAEMTAGAAPAAPGLSSQGAAVPLQEEGAGAGQQACGPWAGSVRVGSGSAAVMALDWTEPLDAQVQAAGNDPRDADFIIAVDTIWLLDIFHSFIDVVLAVLSKDAGTATGGEGLPTTSQRACFLAFIERASADSKLFVRKEAVEQELRARGCAVKVLIAEDVDVDGVARPGRVLRVTLASG